ncbi:uncharacterized protein VP01_159g4 [Puccinia sorghi]|uniref:DUF4219 domain-containing protein n=1 Tax=Puccinia sorghi TaxID=27349 RepID=A0A0L6VJ81_9BASI|nr:uncharacterized protein VP01_159g4 [Puccinia sorghi]
MIADQKSLPILTGSNFISWKIHIKGYCMQHGLSKYLKSTTPPLDPKLKDKYEDKLLKLAGILHQTMGDTNYQRFVSSKNEENPANIWSKLMNYYESTLVQNQSIVFQDFISFTYRKDISNFLDDLDACLSKMAAIGLVIGMLGDLSDSLAAEIILHKIPDNHAAIKAVLHGCRPLTVDVIKEALENKRQEASLSVSALAPTIKQETAYKAANNWPTCKPRWHKPVTKHLIEECWQVKRKQMRSTPAAQPAVESAHDGASDSSIQTTAGAFISIKHALLAGVAQGENHCFLDSGSHHMFRDRYHSSESRTFL